VEEGEEDAAVADDKGREEMEEREEKVNLLVGHE